MANVVNGTNSTGVLGLFNGNAGVGQDRQGIAVHAFVLNIAVGLGLFTFEFSGFLLLKSAAIGRRIYQPKTYLVQRRLRVEAIPINPIAWLRRIVTIKDEELKAKCGIDGYFFIRLVRAMIIIFVPMMVVVVTILIPINYVNGSFDNIYNIEGRNQTYNIKGLDTVSWQNVPPTQTDRHWAHLVCAVVAIVWTVYRIYCEKVNFIDVRQQFLTSPEQRIKASARTVLITNIPAEFRSKEALEALYDVFVDNDDRSKLTVWVNRDYSSLRALVVKRASLRHALEKEELGILRKINKRYQKLDESPPNDVQRESSQSSVTESDAEQSITTAFEADCQDTSQLWRRYLHSSTSITLIEGPNGKWSPASKWKFWAAGTTKEVPKLAWLRSEIARLTIQIENLLPRLDDDETFPRQNSAFIQFDRQMAAHMACSLVSHHKYGRMSPRFLGIAPHEVVWPNMGVTSLWRLIRTLIALVLFASILFLWGLPTTFLGILSQLDNLRTTTTWLYWLRPWPSWLISFISGPLVSILLALLVQLIVPALMRKLAVLIGAPTRSKRELITQHLYFIFLFVELVLVTSISSGIVDIIPVIISNPINIPGLLATNIPKAANYFFNYLIIQGLGFSGSVLFQYLRLLYINLIWPWFTQTPRQEAFLQTTIPHQMWANVYGLITNFAVIGLIYSIISPLMLVFVSMTFSLFWIAYRHNYYYVQRNKVDTHGLLFNNAMSHLFAGVYVLELVLIGLFFLVRNTSGGAVCTPQAVIMIVVLVLTVAFHFVMEQNLQPLYEFLPVSLEDPAVDAEKQRFLPNEELYTSSQGDEPSTSGKEKPSSEDDEPSTNGKEKLVSEDDEPSTNGEEKRSLDSQPTSPVAPEVKAKPLEPMPSKGPKRAVSKNMSATAANARRTLLRLRHNTAVRVLHAQEHHHELSSKAHSREVQDQLGAALESYPDELADLTPEERDAELRAAFQDPVTREPPPVIWLPKDRAGVADDEVRLVRKRYGNLLQYSNTGAFLSARNKCEITQPAPDVRPDWLLDWVL